MNHWTLMKIHVSNYNSMMRNSQGKMCKIVSIVVDGEKLLKSYINTYRMEFECFEIFMKGNDPCSSYHVYMLDLYIISSYSKFYVSQLSNAWVRKIDPFS